MALQEAPVTVDITDIQFKVHSKYQLFNINASTPNYNNIDLLASASAFGLVIVGRPSTTEIQVLQLKDVIENKGSSTIPARSISIPGEPYVLALSCDHTMLSVCYTANGLSFMDIYAVQSFLSNNVKCVLSRVMVSNIDGVRVKQILWNPVIANTVALCLSDGALGAYVIKANSFEYNSLDRSENARCACWSPKGKQIVVAFPYGKLAQYKPDLKLAKTIPCTVQLFSTPFHPLAIQWLSTYQFAVAFIEEKDDSSQSLFIINAPKAAPPTYINYYDITCSQTGPRAPQAFLIHILQWNLLLMASSNGTEIGILGTSEQGELPLWKQYLLMDEARAELPLTVDKQDTFPIGLALETGCTHQLLIGENQIPVMPMLHILSTHGFILSFDLLNFQPTRVDICSPPQPIADQSGLHLFKQCIVTNKSQPPAAQFTTPPQIALTQTSSANEYQVNNITFAIPETGATSTPAKPPSNQSKPIFGMQSAELQQPKQTSLFGGSSSTGFGASGFGLGGSKDVPKPFVAQPTVAPIVPSNNVASTPKAAAEPNKPFLTVQANYKPVAQSTKSSSSAIVSNSENDAILRKLIKEEIEAFDAEIRAALNRSKNVQINICSKEELSKLIKNIDEMQEITTQATESTESLKTDVNSLRLTLYEMHAMRAEAQSKVDEYNKVGKSTDANMTVNQTHRRLVNKLQNLLAQNQARFDVFSKQLDANWSSHLQNQRENDKARMRIPTLENVYQTLEQQQQILMKEKAKINKLKAKIGVCDSISPGKIKYSYSNMDNIKANSLVNSMLSLTIGDQIKYERKSLSVTKLDALRNATLGSRKVNFVKPSRPKQKGINSEVIIEKKLADAKAQKDKENRKKAEQEAERIKQQEQLKVERLKQEEKQKVTQKELNKPKPLLPTPPASQLKPATPKVPETKMIFDGAKSNLPFGITAEKVIPKSDIPSNLNANTNVNASKTVLDTHSGAAPVGFPFGEIPPITSGLSASAGFSFGAATKTNTFGATTTQSKPEALNMAQTVSAASETNVAKPSVFMSTSNTGKESLQSVGNANFNLNITPKPLLSTKNASPLLATPTNIAPSITANVLSNVPANTAPSTSTPFKFDLGNAFSTSNSTDKPKSDKENAPVAATPAATSAASVSPITKTSSAGSFSFLSGSIGSATPPSVKPSTALTSTAISNNSAPASSAPILATASSTPNSIGFSFAKASADTSLFGVSTVTTNVTTATPSATVSSTTDVGSVFQGFNTCKPNVAENANSNKNLFSTNSFGSPASTGSIFGSSAQTPPTSAQPNFFGAKTIATSVSDVPTTTATTTTLFGATSPDSSAVSQSPGSNVFGSKAIESASQSFGSFGLATSPTSSAASPSVPTGNIFSSAAAAKPTQNIFGNAAAPNSNTSTSSIFGGAIQASPSNSFGSNPFGNVTAGNTSNLFGGSVINTSTNATSPTSGSIFGGVAPTTPASGGSIFGGSTSFSTPQQQTAGSIFGSSTFGGSAGVNSAFGSQTSNATASPSVFGNSFAQATSNAPAFGATPAFGSPFGQAVQPIQPTFGSPQQQQQQQPSGFGLSAIAAQSNPTFGSSATFGAAPTFGSPKGSGFGTFANVNQNTSFSSPQKNTLFESLGSSENAMTFGNLAQTQNTAAPKSFSGTSGGASFSSWR